MSKAPMSNNDHTLADIANMLVSLAEKNHNDHGRLTYEMDEIRTSLQYISDGMAACNGLLDIMRVDVAENRERIGILEAQLASLSRRIDQLYSRIEGSTLRMD